MHQDLLHRYMDAQRPTISELSMSMMSGQTNTMFPTNQLNSLPTG